MGAWIEIAYVTSGEDGLRSLPLWERGLKLHTRVWQYPVAKVAPLVGAWIEIPVLEAIGNVVIGRSPCGSVD